MSQKSKSEAVVIDEILLIARAVKKHLNEPNCDHDIRFIVNEALNENAGLPAQQQQASTDAAIPKDQFGNVYKRE